jgi:hypothetical protein
MLIQFVRQACLTGHFGGTTRAGGRRFSTTCELVGCFGEHIDTQAADACEKAYYGSVKYSLLKSCYHASTELSPITGC